MQILTRQSTSWSSMIANLDPGSEVQAFPAPVPKEVPRTQLIAPHFQIYKSCTPNKCNVGPNHNTKNYLYNY